MTGWQDISTAPKVKGKYFFCQLAWGPEWDRCLGYGFRWNGRWFAAAVFHIPNARFDACQFEFRQIEVVPTHWSPKADFGDDVSDRAGAENERWHKIQPLAPSNAWEG